jgi:hypothetical protein
VYFNILGALNTHGICSKAQSFGKLDVLVKDGFFGGILYGQKRLLNGVILFDMLFGLRAT